LLLRIQGCVVFGHRTGRKMAWPQGFSRQYLLKSPSNDTEREHQLLSSLPWWWRLTTSELGNASNRKWFLNYCTHGFAWNIACIIVIGNVELFVHSPRCLYIHIHIYCWLYRVAVIHLSCMSDGLGSTCLGILKKQSKFTNNCY